MFTQKLAHKHSQKPDPQLSKPGSNQEGCQQTKIDIQTMIHLYSIERQKKKKYSLCVHIAKREEPV